MLSAIHQIYRILRRNSLLIIINEEVHFPNRVSDYPPLLKNAGFEGESYNEVPKWKRRRKLFIQKIIFS
ncbi:MAG: hypothetical protein ACFFCC_07195 [Promethearchaeota archaeon]